MTVNIALPDGTTTVLQVEGSDRIEAVRTRIGTQTDIPPRQQRLLFDGQLLSDGLTLADYGVGAGATLTLRYAILSESAVMGVGGGHAAAGPYEVTDTIGQPLVSTLAAGDPGADLGFWATLFMPPVVPSRFLAVRSGQTTSLPTGKLLTRVHDDDLDTFTFGGLDVASEQGGTLILSGGVILYSAPERWTGSDRFTYTVVDSGGDFGIGIVHVSVLASATANIVSAVLSAGPPPTFQIRYVGIPGATYEVQASTDLHSWTTVAGSESTIPAGGSQIGSGAFVDDATGEFRYYRTRYLRGP
jgi:hypothetical protein